MARASERPNLVPADPVREHVMHLIADCGLTKSDIANIANVDMSAVSYLLYGRPREGQAPPPRIPADRAERLMAVTGEETDGRKLHPNGPLNELVQRLMLQGYSLRDIKALTGISTNALSDVINMSRPNTSAGTAAALRSLAVKVGNEPGPSPEAARLARTRGYPMPAEEIGKTEFGDAAEACRQLRELGRNGYSLDGLSTSLDIGVSYLSLIRSGDKRMVPQRTLTVIDQFYSTHRNRKGPSWRGGQFAARLWTEDGDWDEITQFYVLSGPSRELLIALTEAGWPVAVIAEGVGISAPFLGNIIRGDAQKTSPRIARAIKLFADAHAGLGPSRKAAWVASRRRVGVLPAADFTLMIRHLTAVGWTGDQAARETGLTYQLLTALRTGRAKSLARPEARLITDFYVAHYGLGPSSGTRAKARENGYVEIWRVAPRLVPPDYRLRLSDSAMHGIEINLRPWLANLRLTSFWRELPNPIVKFLNYRFRLAAGGELLTLSALTAASGLTESKVRAWSTNALLALTSRAELPMNGYEPQLRGYLVALASA